MYSLWVVVVFLLTLLRNISITISYIRNTEPDNKVMVDGRFRDSIAKYRNNIGNYASIDNDRKSTGHEESDIKKYKEKSSVQDMFMLKEPIRFKVSYPPAEYRFFKSMLNKDLCDQYTLECIYYRSEYPQSRLSFDHKTGQEYNPCHRFVEPCFGISENDYKVIKKFTNLRDY